MAGYRSNMSQPVLDLLPTEKAEKAPAHNDVDTQDAVINKAALVTVITANYNGSRYIQAAIESVQRQTYTNLEHIIIDDGSTDSSVDLLEALAQQYPNVKIIRLIKNSGVSVARNTGIAQAKGKYVSFLDADDTWHADKISEQVAVFERHPQAGVVVTHMQHINASGEQIPSPKKSKHIAPLKFGRVSIRDFIAGDIPISINAMTQKQCLDAVGNFNPNYIIGEDYELWMRILESFEYYYVNKPLHYYRLHDCNATSNKLKNRESKIKILEELVTKKPALKAELGRSFAVIMQRKYNSLGKAYFKHRDTDKARESFLKVHEFNGSLLQRIKSYLWINYLRFAK